MSGIPGFKQLVKKYVLLPALRKRAMAAPSVAPEIHDSIIQLADYTRYATFALAIQRLLDENIAGSFAEAGVYRGHMSSFLHRLAPDRTYYLFDTFEGFPQSDLEPGVKEDRRFSDTSVDLVLATIGDTKNIVVKKGYVPDTFTGLDDERFAFVLLDLDLHKPTVAGLEFFYPRLVSGGYLAVHDYNNPESNYACKRSVDAFMKDKPEHIIEVADRFGTVMLRKL
jgi:O-methyltransferase